MSQHAQTLEAVRGEVIAAHLLPTARRAPEPTVYKVEPSRPRSLAGLRGDALTAAKVERINAAVKGNVHRVSGTQRSKKKSTMPLDAHAFRHARVVSALRELPNESQQWLNYAYADSRDWSDEAGVVVAVWRELEPTLVGAKGKTYQRCKALTHLAVQDHKSRKNSGKRLYKCERLQELLAVTGSNWEKHWSPRWQTLHRILSEIDERALERLFEITPEIDEETQQ